MKLCFLAGANSIHSYRWIKYFSESGHDVVWISLHANIFSQLPNVRYYEINVFCAPLGLLKSALEVRRIIELEQPDILHLQSVGTYGVMGLLSGFNPIVATAWGSDVIYGKRSFLKRRFIERVLRRAKLITCDAWHMKDEIMLFGVPNEQIEIINFGIDTERFSHQVDDIAFRENYQLGNSPTVISLRNFEPVYDIPTLIKAIPLVLVHHPNTNFIFVGHGTLENELKSLVSEMDIFNNVRFIGFVPNVELPKILSSQDIYVSTSLSDAGIAASTAEAMACEVPVIVSDTGENSRWINDGENGFLVPARDPETLANRIVELLNDKNLRGRMGQAGRCIIKKFNDYKVEMAKMNVLYDKIMVSK